jgi:replication factor C subunit 1
LLIFFRGDLWTVKYAPTDISHIIGNQGNIIKLRQWLQEWRRKKIPSERAVLVSGPPGIGKTTAAQVVSKNEGFKVLEYNASDTRSKKALHDTIQDMLSNRSMAEYHGGSFFQPVLLSKSGTKSPPIPILKSAEKAVVIMDEVDGMSAGDRGGIAELILLIKKSKVPIICICNDRASPKVRSLANYCLDLRFRR